jgi:N-acetyl-1-D-myo-inositol-2-amino-2-deoxy-alpha-D-glucopyranoside deacetylase
MISLRASPGLTPNIGVVPKRPTIVLVHAHPDDEASSTGGTIAHYAAHGARVILVTCTNGELGDSPQGLAPDHDDHDTDAVVAHRLEELEASCDILGVERLVLLGYHDSGMMGWPQNDNPECFWQTPVDVAASRLAEILDEEDADVVITYDENGFYGHPDHIQANRITLRALELASVDPKLYYATIARSAFDRMGEMLEAAGVERPEPEEPEEERVEMGTDDALIGAVIDVTDYTDLKRAALMAHASQTASSFFLQVPEEMFRAMFVTEWFVRVQDPTGQSGVEDDLLAGIA